MSTARLVGLNLVMWTAGLVAFALFTWSVAWLDAQPVEIPDAVEVAAVPDAGLATITAGTARSASAAREHLRLGQRSAASHALDAAMRVAEVGLETSHGDVKTAFAIGEHAIVQAREALHDGRAAAAMDHLDEAATALEEVVEPARDMSVGVPPEPVRPGWDGAVLINALGGTIGEVQGVEMDGDQPVAVVHVGGGNDVLGLFEVGGETVRVPADTLLWGPRRSLGNALVAAPVESRSLGQLTAG